VTAGARIASDTAGPGAGGTVTVTAREVLHITGHGSGLFTNTAGPGRGGDLTLQVQQLQLADGAAIGAESTGTGIAGNLTLTVADAFLSAQSTVTTAAGQADGGNIAVTAQRLVRVQDSQISTAVGSGTGAGGNLTLASEFVLLERSQLTANAFGGPGGNITIQAGVFLADPASQVTASSAQNIAGTITIQAQLTNLSGLVAPLPQTFGPAVTVLRDRCAARLRQGMVSSLVTRGRDGLPVTPMGVLPSRLVREPSETPPGPAPGPPRAEAPRPGGLRHEPLWALTLRPPLGECAAR